MSPVFKTGIKLPLGQAGEMYAVQEDNAQEIKLSIVEGGDTSIRKRTTLILSMGDAARLGDWLRAVATAFAKSDDD